MSANYINHIALVLDASDSMRDLSREVVQVADAQTAYLAQRSKELDQETRVSVYVFSDAVQCVVYDKDVLRLPSIAKHYRTAGMTALIDATLKSQEDLGHTPELYGDHAFLTYVLTDGQENASHRRPSDLLNRLATQPDHWTVAVLVPDQRCKFEAKKFGFPADNIAIWDATSAQGVVEVGKTIRQATENFMVSRTSGVRGSRSLFQMDATALNKATIKAAKLKALPKTKFTMLDVDEAAPIREWVIGKGHNFYLGIAYYQLTKRESIQPQKNIAVLEKSTGRVFSGDQVRDMLGLRPEEVRVSPEDNDKFDVFVQSTSVNRKLVPGTKLLLIN